MCGDIFGALNFDEVNVDLNALLVAVHHPAQTFMKNFHSLILPSLLRFEYRNSMMFSIESRTPFFPKINSTSLENLHLRKMEKMYGVMND